MFSSLQKNRKRLLFIYFCFLTPPPTPSVQRATCRRKACDPAAHNGPHWRPEWAGCVRGVCWGRAAQLASVQVADGTMVPPPPSMWWDDIRGRRRPPGPQCWAALHLPLTDISIPETTPLWIIVDIVRNTSQDEVSGTSVSLPSFGWIPDR